MFKIQNYLSFDAQAKSIFADYGESQDTLQNQRKPNVYAKDKTIAILW